MAEEGADPKDRPWNMNEWCWDPYNMLALATDPKGCEPGAKPAASFPFGAGPYGSQSQLAPAASLLLDEVSRGVSRPKGPATCQVAGCSADLTTLKEYHQRYKICEFHLKVSSIIREGKRQRFCQQCGRFHDLTSFDGDKRSCRARLQRHNARRRKKTADIDAPSAGKAPPVKRQSSIPRGSREYLRSDSSKKQQTSDSASMDTKQESLGVRDESLETDSQQHMRQSLRNSNSVNDGQVRLQLRGGGGSHAMLGEESGSQLAARLNSSTFGTEQMQMPFHGQSVGMPAQLPSSGDLPGSFPAMGYGHDGSMDSLDCLGDVGLFPPQQSDSMPDYSDLNQAASQMQSTGFGTDHSGASTATAASLVDEARTLLTYSGQYQAIKYTSEEHLTRLSAKLFKCTPEQLPGDLKANLLAMLQCGVNALEGYIRPGCLHLTLNAMLGSASEQQLKALDVRGLFAHLATSTNKALWSTDTLVLQWYDEAALVRAGKIVHVLSCAGSQGVVPQLEHVHPMALHTGAPEQLLLTGTNLAILNNRVHVRCLGQDVAVEVLSSGFLDADGPEDRPSYVEVKVPEKQPAGLLHVEIARGSLLSRSKPVLMLDQADVAAELNHLQELEHVDVDTDGLLLDLGRIVELRHAIAAAKFGSSVPVRSFSAADMADMAQLGRRLLRLAIDTACVALATFVLPVAVSDAESMGAAVQKIEAALDMPLLLRAVRSQSMPLVEMVLEWTSGMGVDLMAGVPGPQGLTALHVAAVMGDGASLAALLTEVCPDGASAWTAARSCGASPADLAYASGNQATNDHVLRQLRMRLAAASAGLGDIEEDDGMEDDVALDPETGEVPDCADLPTSTAEGPQPAAKVGPPTEEALQRLSEARRQETGQPAARELRHESSSMTTGSSINTPSMCSTDTVLPRAANITSADSMSSMRKRLTSEAMAPVTLEYTPEEKGMGSPRCYASGKGAGLEFFQDAACVKVAPTVFDGTYALASALLISMFGGFTLLLRYCGNTFMD